MVLTKTLVSPLDYKEIQCVSPIGNKSCIFIGKTDADTETPIVWLPDAKSWLIGKDPDAGKDWRQEEKGTTEDEMVGWHHQLERHEFQQALGVCDGQGSLACWSLWSHKESDATEQLNWAEVNPLQYSCLENSMDRAYWQATVHGVTKSQTQLSNWTELYYY